MIGFLEENFFERLKDCEDGGQNLCGECDECEFHEIFEKYSPSFVLWVAELRRGIQRLRLDPSLSRLYTLEELDLMAVINEYELSQDKERTAQELRALCQITQSK